MRKWNRIAIVHQWLLSMRGAERVAEAMCDLFPDADLFTLIYVPEKISPAIRRHKVRTSFLQKLPGSARYHRRLALLFPFAAEQFDLKDYDLVISSDWGVAKSIITRPETCHVCYCHTPPRYAWSLYHFYRNFETNWLERFLMSGVMNYFRVWDLATSFRVDYFIGNSQNVARRIRKYYRRDAEVIYPPVDTCRFQMSDQVEDYYRGGGELLPNKRHDLPIEACSQLKRRLLVVGSGLDYKRLRQLAGPTVELLGAVRDEELARLYARCRALIFPAEEDFGIIPVEVQAAGRPVIAYRAGGAMETVVEGVTGMFFNKQEVASLQEVILAFETKESSFDPETIRQHALQFDLEVFQSRLMDFLQRKWPEYLENYGC